MSERDENFAGLPEHHQGFAGKRSEPNELHRTTEGLLEAANIYIHQLLDSLAACQRELAYAREVMETFELRAIRAESALVAADKRIAELCNAHEAQFLRAEAAEAEREKADERWREMWKERGRALAECEADNTKHQKARLRADIRVERLTEALKAVEQHCPCGARPESLRTHPHVIGCPVGTALSPHETP